MAKSHLTDAAVDRLRRPTTGRKEFSDSEPGLFLWVTPNGRKSWTVVYRTADRDGKRTQRRKKVIGRYPAMKVSDARERTREIMELAAGGLDPELVAEERRAEQVKAEAESRASAFRTVAEEYVAAMEAGKLVGGRKRPVAPTTAAGRKSLLERLVVPVLGDYSLADVTPTIVSRLLANIEEQDGPVDETLKVIRGTFKFAVSRGLFHGQPPTAGMTNRQPPKKETRALRDDELRAIWTAAAEQGWPFGSIVRLLMLTGQRRTEIAAMRWQEVDWERRLILLPADRVKNRAGVHEVPLSEPAMAILREAKAAREALLREPDGSPVTIKPTDFVFPSNTGDTPISGWNKLKAALDRNVRANIVGLSEAERRAVRAAGALRPETMKLKANAWEKLSGVDMAPWRIHDLRHTFITRSRDGEENEEGEIVWSAPLDVLQATVNHQITAGVTAIYDHGDIQRRYRLRKRELMDWWAEKLLSIVS